MDRMPRRLSLGLAVLLALAASQGAAASEPAAPRRAAYAGAPAVPARVAVSFKVDPRLTRSLFMGDRWVSPATYASTVAEAGEPLRVSARAAVLDTRGRPLRATPAWTPADPAMLTVKPVRKDEVELTVHREGETRLRVSHGAVSKTLAVKTVAQAGGWRVEISQ